VIGLFSTHLVSNTALSTPSLRPRETFCLIETTVFRCSFQSFTHSQTLQRALLTRDLSEASFLFAMPVVE